MDKLTGKLTSTDGLSGTLSATGNITGEIGATEEKIIGQLTAIAGISGILSAQGGVSGRIGVPDKVPVDPYMGDYTITPRLDEQTFLTKGYRMTDDVTVREIPVVATSNIYGGKTVVIG